MPISAVIFDFDGVIANTEPLHLGAFQEVFSDRGWRLDEREYIDRYLGYDDRGLVVAYAGDRGLTLSSDDVDRIVDAKIALFSRHISSPTVLYPGAADVIQRIGARFRLGIASGALRHEIVSILTAGALLDVFQVIVASDDVATCKPSPEPYLAAAAALGVAPHACLAIEDSLPGLQAARAAGMATIAVTTTSPADVLEKAADRVVAGLHELSPDLLADIGALRAL